jgi:hypothetical protein
MCWTETEALQDAQEQIVGHDVEVGCQRCGESWPIRVFEGEGLTDEQTECPTDDCTGIGVEL